MNLPTSDEIIDDLSFFDDWEQRYQYIIDLGKALPKMADEAKTPDKLIKGCQSSVWLDYQSVDGAYAFEVDSDAIIVQGLLAVVLAAYDHKSAKDIIEFDINAYFNELDLEAHISPTRGNGLRAIVTKIRHIAQTAL